MKRPLIPILLVYIAGILTGNNFHVPGLFTFTIFLISVIILTISAVKKMAKLTALCMLISLFFLGIININFYLNIRPHENNICHHTGKKKVIVEGLICKNPQVSSKKTDLVIDSSRIIKNGSKLSVKGKILLTVDDNHRSFKYGDYVRVKTRLKKPHNFNNPGGFDYKKYLLFRGIRVRGYVNNASHVIVLRENQGNALKQNIEKFRSALRKLISDNAPLLESKILQAIILGERKEIPKDILEKFNHTGLSHVLAISGFHIGIVALISFFTIKTLIKSSEYLLLRFNIMKASAIFTLVPIIGYTLIAGANISTVRASIMAVTFLLAVLIGREQDMFNTLAFAAFIILAFSPASLFAISFQLSFIAVAAILLITPVLKSLISKNNSDPPSLRLRLAYKSLLFIIVSLSAVIGTAPIIAFYFNRISTVTLLSNILVIPVIGFIVLPIGILIIIAAPLSSFLTAILINIASFFISISLAIIDFLASFPFSSIQVTTPTIPEIAFYYLLLITGFNLITLYKMKNGNKLKRISLVFLFAFSFLFFFINSIYLYCKGNNSNYLEITFIDVGQGNSAFIKFPNSLTMLVDGGGFCNSEFDVGEYVVSPFLLHERVKRVDIVVLTHPHEDHLGGLVYVLKNFCVKEVWTNGEKTKSESYINFIDIINKKNIAHRIMYESTDEIKFGKASARIINPPEKVNQRSDTNNNSLVIKIVFDSIGILLPADITRSAEERILAREGELKSNIILAPHHGGHTSSTVPFLEKMQPEIAVFSCGLDNKFSFPSPNVLQRYKAIDTRIYRTDKNGAVTIKTDGKSFKISCFK